jgi:hypothetical protein
MVRSILGVILGLVVATAVFLVFETVGMMLYPLPPGVNLTDQEALRAAIATLPGGALLVVLLGYIVGTFCGAAVAVLVARRAPVVHALVVCGVVMAAGVANLASLPHPAWFWVAALAAYPLAAVAAALVARPRVKPLAA